MVTVPILFILGGNLQHVLDKVTLALSGRSVYVTPTVALIERGVVILVESVVGTTAYLEIGFPACQRSYGDVTGHTCALAAGISLMLVDVGHRIIIVKRCRLLVVVAVFTIYRHRRVAYYSLMIYGVAVLIVAFGKRLEHVHVQFYHVTEQILCQVHLNAEVI